MVILEELTTDHKENLSSYPPNTQVVPTGSQEVRVNPLGVWDPHDLGGGVRVVKRVPADKLWTLLLQTHQLNLCRNKNITWDYIYKATRLESAFAIHGGIKAYSY